MTASSRTGSPSTPAGAASAVTGLLIVRVWLEPDHNVTLRARITRSVSADPEAGLESQEPTAGTITVATAEDILAAVRAWLDSFVASDHAAVNGGPGHGR